MACHKLPQGVWCWSSPEAVCPLFCTAMLFPRPRCLPRPAEMFYILEMRRLVAKVGLHRGVAALHPFGCCLAPLGSGVPCCLCCMLPAMRCLWQLCRIRGGCSSALLQPPEAAAPAALALMLMLSVLRRKPA